VSYVTNTNRPTCSTYWALQWRSTVRYINHILVTQWRLSLNTDVAGTYSAAWYCHNSRGNRRMQHGLTTINDWLLISSVFDIRTCQARYMHINININICSIELGLKWDGKITKLWYENEMRWIRITVWNGRADLLCLKKLKKLMHLFIDTYKSNNDIKISVNDMTVNDREMCVRWKDEAWSIPEISVLR